MISVHGRLLNVCVRVGEPGGTPLLLCNGIGASLDVLQPLVDALDPGREVIRFDLPGIGGSAPPVLPYHLLTLAPLVAALLDRLGRPRADVLGISWGGGLAQELALRQPCRVRRLVLAATGAGILMVPAPPRVLRHMLTPRRHRDPGHAVRIAGQTYGGSMRTDPARAGHLLSTRAAVTRRGYYYQLLAGLGWTSLPLLPLLRQPTLLLAGDDDPVIPLANAKIMKRLMPRAELHVYRGGHLELIAQPHRLAPVVESFLDHRQPHQGPKEQGHRSA